MNKLGYKQFSERHRPHIHPVGATLFITFRLAGSIPASTVRDYHAKKAWLADQVKRATNIPARHGEALKERVRRFEREWTVKFEAILHKAQSGPMWMKDERVADCVTETLHRLDGNAYRLDCFSVMSNHVHVVFKPLLAQADLHQELDEDGLPAFVSEHPSLARIMHSMKGRSARECNLILSRRGQFWEHESFDHVIRDGRFSATVKYVLNNPVKAGLVGHWRDWPWNYCRADIADEFLM